MSLIDDYMTTSENLKVSDLEQEVSDRGDYDLEVYESAQESMRFNDIDDLMDWTEENYQGQYNSDEEFTEQLLEDTGTIPENLPSYVYIDWERTSRDIMYDYIEENGHYFRNS